MTAWAKVIVDLVVCVDGFAGEDVLGSGGGHWPGGAALGLDAMSGIDSTLRLHRPTDITWLSSMAGRIGAPAPSADARVLRAVRSSEIWQEGDR